MIDPGGGDGGEGAAEAQTASTTWFGNFTGVLLPVPLLFFGGGVLPPVLLL